MSAERERKPTWDPEYIRDLSVTVYRARLEEAGPGNVARMIEKDKDHGEKLRNRAGQYDPLTRVYLGALGLEPPARAIDPRDPDYSRKGIFVYHDCYKCKDGALPCVNKEQSACEYPRARND